MILTLLASVAIAQAAQQGTPPAQVPANSSANPTPKVLLEKMIARYHDAKSLAGKIVLSQTAGNTSVSIETDIQFDRPSQLLIRQTKTGAQGRRWVVISDGVKFSYDRPDDSSFGPDRFVEFVSQNGVQQTIADMWSAALNSTGDRSPVLEILIAKKENLRGILRNWGSMSVTGKAKIREQDVFIIEGDYHEIPGAEATGKFGFAVTEAGDILRHSLRQRVMVPQKLNEVIEIRSVWEVDVKVNVPTNPNLYKF